jgi:hypothetical protein
MLNNTRHIGLVMIYFGDDAVRGELAETALSNDVA